MRVNLGPANLRDNEMRGFEIGKRNVLVGKVGGRYLALDDWCNHAGCLLSGGWLEKRMVICPCHKVGFDLETGRNMSSPGVCGDQEAYRIVLESGSMILEGFDP